MAKQKLNAAHTALDKLIRDEQKARQKVELGKVLEVVNEWLADKDAKPYLVAHVPISANAKALTEAFTAVKKKAADRLVYLLTGDDKVAHGCYISDAAIAKGADAAALGKAASEHIGGKAGGKGNTVQGMGDNAAGIDAAVEAISKMLAEKL